MGFRRFQKVPKGPRVLKEVAGGMSYVRKGFNAFRKVLEKFQGPILKTVFGFPKEPNTA